MRLLATFISILSLLQGEVQNPEEQKPVPVKVVVTKKGFQLLRGGKPYFVKGAGGNGSLALLKERGGNSIRTWGAEKQKTLLDTAQKLGMTVTVGIWLGHERHGFKYDDPKMVSEQLETARKFVREYRNHPALLAWGLGNEMEGSGENPLIWKAVNDIAKMVKEEDPNHPTMTIVAEITPKKIESIKQHCPDIDILGINSYGGMPSLPKRLRDAGWNRPFLITEFGTNGPWEVRKTPWGAPIEPSSTEKTTTFLTNYMRVMETYKHWCLGSYAFHWGQKQEATSTWFNLLLKDGTLTEPVDSLTFAWTGKEPANHAPRLLGIECDANEAYIAPGSAWAANVLVLDVEGDPITVRWELRSESNDRKEGGDAEGEPMLHKDAMIEASGTVLRFRAPAQEGAYRLFVFVMDKMHASTMNIPFYVGKKPS
jgi:hypothetical protein